MRINREKREEREGTKEIGINREKREEKEGRGKKKGKLNNEI